MEVEPIRRDARALSRCPNLRRQRSISPAVDAVEQAHGGRVISSNAVAGENGVVRVKIVLSRQQLRQLVASTGRGRSAAAQHAPAGLAALEQRLHALRRRHIRRAEAGNAQRRGWRPELQSIPEEI